MHEVSQKVLRPAVVGLVPNDGLRLQPVTRLVGPAIRLGIGRGNRPCSKELANESLKLEFVPPTNRDTELARKSLELGSIKVAAFKFLDGHGRAKLAHSTLPQPLELVDQFTLIS